jgi:hypothetical protein
MIHGGGHVVQRLLDRAERLLWEEQDATKLAAGWQVIKLGRWHRTYRHPALVAAAARSQQRRRRPTRIQGRAA